jgi:hypothetical protein
MTLTHGRPDFKLSKLLFPAQDGAIDQLAAKKSKKPNLEALS